MLQKINGWKIYHLAAGMEDIVDMESELSKRLQEVMVMVVVMVMAMVVVIVIMLVVMVVIAMIVIVYFRLVEDLRRRPTVRWARSWARWRPHIQNDHLK